MHEVSIADSLLSIAVRECKSSGFSKIGSIKVSIGNASGVMPEALLFAFDALKTGTIADKASLIIEKIPILGHCNLCNSDFIVNESFVLYCPHCKGTSFTLKCGRELNITELDVF